MNKGTQFDEQALGEKNLWILKPNKVEWWKQGLWNKYFYGSRRKSSTLRLKGTTGTSIFKLFFSSSPLIMERLNWIPGNGRLINPWEDKIMESGNTKTLMNLLPIRGWLESHDFHALADLSIQDMYVTWIKWK
jgi:hypothetical protein